MTLSSADVIDRSAVLDRVGGDEDLLREIACIFIEEYPDLLASIRTAVACRDARSLEVAAHTLKGAVANFGAEPATEAAFRLEVIGKRGPISDAPLALRELERQFQMLVPVLQGLTE